jgi:hypothetical protein
MGKIIIWVTYSSITLEKIGIGSYIYDNEHFKAYIGFEGPIESDNPRWGMKISKSQTCKEHF